MAARGANPFVPAGPVRTHLLRLQRQGVGLRSISEACDVARSQLSDFRSGKRNRLTKAVADRILAVTFDCAKDWVLIPADKPLRQLAELRAEGFKAYELAAMIGQPNSNAPQVGKNGRKVTTVAMAGRVDRIWRKYMTVNGVTK